MPCSIGRPAAWLSALRVPCPASPDVRRVSRIRVRNVGSQVFVDLNVEVPRHLSFEESHAVTQRAQEARARKYRPMRTWWCTPIP